MEFYARKEQDEKNGIIHIVLGCINDENPEMNQEIHVLPELGSNMCKYKLGGKYDIIEFNPARMISEGFSGTPVLYPTPNRVRDCTYSFQGETVRQVKHGKGRFIHGIVYDEAFEYDDPEVSDDGASLRTYIEINETSPLFESFPFANRLSLEFRLEETGLTINYKVENRGNKRMPFGFALHPYFRKLCRESDIILTVPAHGVMKATLDLLPTGDIIEVQNTEYDLSKGASLEKLNLDHVYTELEFGKDAIIEYGSLGLRLRLKSTPDFSHMVVYTPKNREYFCVENQTCSTDAHNLYDRGLVRESGLIVLEPGQIHEGSVSYIPEYLY